MKNILFPILIVFCFQSVFSQSSERPNYSLLWEISKDSISQKSYLFGTAHLKDRRVFQFPDALIPAIKSSQVFALEVQPEELSNSVMEEFFTKQDTNFYKKILSKDEYKKLDKRFYEINQTPLDSFPLDHPMLLPSLLEKETKKEDDMHTFLDAYLYNIAVEFDREISGLEDIEDQLPDMDSIQEAKLKTQILQILERNPKDSELAIERLIDLYYDGDISQIYFWSNGFYPLDDVMVARNIKMTSSMDSIMQNKTLFAAIGAAHLPGDEGVLSLLKEKGYTVTKVNATFNNEEFVLDLTPKLDKWQRANFESLGYTVKTPTSSNAMAINDQLDVNIAIDLRSGSSFGHFGINLGLRDDPNILNEISKRQEQSIGGTVISKEEFIRDGYKFIESYIDKGQSMTKMRVYKKDKFIYAFYSEGQPHIVKGAYTDAFFDSINFFTPKAAPVFWKTEVNPTAAFSIDFPGEIKTLSREVANPLDAESVYDLRIFSSIDQENKIQNLIRYNDQPMGYYLQNIELASSQFVELFETLGTITNEPKFIDLDNNVKYVEYQILSNSNNYSIARLFFRGNRTYLILSQKLVPNETIDSNYRFLSSFKFLPYGETKFDQELKDENLKVLFPNKPKIIYEEELAYGEYEYTKAYGTTDSITGEVYLLEKIKLRPYVKIKDIEKYFQDHKSDLTSEEGDTIVKERKFTIGNNPAMEVVIGNKLTLTNQKVTFFLKDDNLYSLTISAGFKEEERNDAFLNSLVFNKSKNEFDVTANKGKLIFKDLKSKDSLKFKNAIKAFNYYSFDKDEYKLLLNNLDYEFGDLGKSSGVKHKIIKELALLETKTTGKEFKKRYHKTKQNDEKIGLLEYIGGLKGAENEEIFLDLIQTNPPQRKEVYGYTVFDEIKNPIDFLTRNEDVLIKMLDNELYRDKLVSLYYSNVVTDSTNNQKLKKFKERAVSYFVKDVKRYIEVDEREKYPYLHYSLISNYINIIRKQVVDLEVVSETLLPIIEYDGDKDWLKISAMMRAIEQNVQIPEAVLTNYVDDLAFRYETMNSLIDNKRDLHLAQEYLENVELGKLSIYYEGSYDYEEFITEIKHLGTTVHNDIEYNVYSFVYNYDSETTYIGFNEAKEGDVNNFELTKTYFIWETSDLEWTDQVKNHLNNLETEKG